MGSAAQVGRRACRTGVQSRFAGFRFRHGTCSNFHAMMKASSGNDALYEGGGRSPQASNRVRAKIFSAIAASLHHPREFG
jgi:hypothetical protein